MIKNLIKNSEITFIIILINVILFVLETLAWWSTNNQVAANFGVFYSPVFTLQPWRAISAMFLHFWLAHLVMNMYALYCIGPVIEKTFWRWKYLIIYLFSWIMWNLTVYAVEMATWSYSFSAWASWAIFWLLWAIVALIMSLPESIRSRINTRDITSTIILNIAIGFLPWVSMSAHLWWLVWWFIIAYIFAKFRKTSHTIEYDE